MLAATSGAGARRRPPRSARRPRCWPRTWASGPCSATPGPTRSAPCSAPPPPSRCPGPPASPLAAVVGLTAASEVVSFTRSSSAPPPLHWLDMLGRRPAPARHRGTGAAGRRQPGNGSPARRDGGRRPGSGRAGRPAAPASARRSDRARAAGHRRRSRSAAARPRPAIGAGIGRAAALIAVLTVCARAAGPGPPGGLRAYRRGVLPGHRVHDRQPGAQHHLRHRAGRRADQRHGAGAGPVRAAGRPPTRPPRRQVTQTSSALLTWTVVILAPVSVSSRVAAGPIARLLSPANPARALRPRQHDRPDQPHDHGVRAAGALLRAGRGAVRDTPGPPPVHRARAGAGHLQPGGDGGVPAVRAVRRGPPRARGRAAACPRS